MEGATLLLIKTAKHFFFKDEKSNVSEVKQPLPLLSK